MIDLIKMDSKTRCNSYKYIERYDIIIPHHCYSGDLPIEIILSDICYIKSQITCYDKDTFYFLKNLEEIINKLKDDNYNCRYHHFDTYSIDEKLIYMLLPVLDYIVRKLYSDSFFSDLKYKLELDLEVRVHHSSVEDPENDSS